MTPVRPEESTVPAVSVPAGDAPTVPALPMEGTIPDWVRFFPLFPRLEERILSSGRAEAPNPEKT